MKRRRRKWSPPRAQPAALNPAIGLSLLTFVAIGVLALAALCDRQLLVARVPLDKSIDALQDRAREIAERLGYGAKPADSARGLTTNGEYLRYLDPVQQLGRRAGIR